MKRYVVYTFLALFIPAVVYAAGVIGKDRDKNVTQDFMPSTIGVLTATKADMTLNTTALHAVRVQPSVAVTLKFNGTGDSWPIAANTVQEYRIPADVTSMVFSATSSASNKVYYQAE